MSRRMSEEDRALRKAAYAAVAKALRQGVLVRPAVCDNCHKDRPEAHHHMGYTPEHALNVLWLCQFCHVAMHSNGSCPPQTPELVRTAYGIIARWQLSYTMPTAHEATALLEALHRAEELAAQPLSLGDVVAARLAEAVALRKVEPA